nr:ribonuclease H-like domain-containing protein [Tanacetum cinerariifolium]
IAKLTHAVNQQTSVVTTAMTAILKQFQPTPPLASVKVVEEICVTCGGAHPYYQCLTAGGNTFPELRDNIQGYVAAAIVNYNHGNFVYRPPAMANQIPPSGSGSLPRNTIANPKGELKSITIRSGIVLDGPSVLIPFLFVNPKEDERVEETLTDQDLAEYTIKPSGNPTFSSHPELTSSEVKDDIFDPEGGNVLPKKLLDLDFTKDLHPPLHVNPLSGNTTYFSFPNQLLEEFADELALITFPLEYDDDLQFDIEFDLKEIEYLLHHDPIKDIDSSLKYSIDQSNLADLNDNLVDSMLEMFTDEHALNYTPPLQYDEYDDDLFEVESDTKNVYDDPFDSKGEKIKESKLDVDAMNYSSWVYYFSYVCHGYRILDHLVDPVTSSSTATPMDPPPKDAEWTKIDLIIRSWTFSTVAPSLRKCLVDLNPTTTKDAWTYIAGIFQDNKHSRAMALKAELRNLKLGDLSIVGYFQKIESIVLVLNGLGSPLAMMMLLLSRLRVYLPPMKRSLSLLVQNPLVDATSASPKVLLAKSNTSARCGPSLEKVNNPCWIFAKGSCRFGDSCKYLYNGVYDKSTLLPRTLGSTSSVPDVTRLDLDMLQSPLAKFGLNAPNTSTPSPPVTYTVYVPPGGFSIRRGHYRKGSIIHSRGSYAFWSTVGAGASSSQGLGQATLLPNTFNTTTLQDLASGNWNMDTGASSHLNDFVHYLSDILNMCIYPSVAVGDGHFIPITNSGHSLLSTPFYPLHLNNVLITPNIVKNLIYVCQFVCDNSCTVEFDPFGFYVKDFKTQRVLLRCDSTGDLYPVTKPSTIPHAFLTSQYAWHQ